MIRSLMVLMILCALQMPSLVMAEAPQSPIGGEKSKAGDYPKIVLYSTSWCPHCKAAKEYLTTNNIPFINRDVELDSQALELMTVKYKSQGVPVIVFGDGPDEIVMRGFQPSLFQENLQKAQAKKKS